MAVELLDLLFKVIYWIPSFFSFFHQFIVFVVTVTLFSFLCELCEHTDLFSSSRKKKIMAALDLKSLNLNKYESRLLENIILPEDLDVSWSDVAGLDDVIQKFKKNVIYPLMAKKFNSKAVSCPKGVLLYGPPGCGKTHIAKAIAKEVKCCFINIDVSSLFGQWFGTSEKNVKGVFTLAEKVQPCIIFIDEIDSLLGTRSRSDHEVTMRAKTLFMTLWDGLITDASKTVIIMGATNKPAEIDNAIKRRMPLKISIPLPNLEQRKQVLDLLLETEELDDDVDTKALAEITEGFSCSDLKDIVREAGINCLEDESRVTSEPLDSMIASENSSKNELQVHPFNPLAKVASVISRRSLLYSILHYQFPQVKKLQEKKEKGDLTIISARPFSMQDLINAILGVNDAKALCNVNWA